jgi:hypothetical protein
LVENENTRGKTKLSDFRDVKIGVAMSTPADAYLFDNGYKRSIFVGDWQIFKALESGEIGVALYGLQLSPMLEKIFRACRFTSAIKCPKLV